MTEKSYEDGLQEGAIIELTKITVKHDARLGGHSERLRGLERAFWLAGGFVIAVQAIPTIQTLLNFLGKSPN